MPFVVTDLLQSKKFVSVLGVSVLALVAAWLGVLTKAEVLTLLGVLWPVYLGAQGLSDVGAKLGSAHEVVQAERQQGITLDQERWQGIVTAFLAALPSLLPSLGGPAVGSSVSPAPLKKGDKVLHLLVGPDDVGVVLEDQPTASVQKLDSISGMKVRVAFSSGKKKDGDLFDRLDLIKVSDDYVGPSAEKSKGSSAAGSATVTPIKPVPAPGPSAQGTS
jgi:hypothetical protein